MFRRDCSATAGPILTKSSPVVFPVLFVNGGTPMKIGPQKNFGAQNVHFLEQKFKLRRLRMAAAPKQRGIPGTKRQTNSK